MVYLRIIIRKNIWDIAEKKFVIEMPDELYAHYINAVVAPIGKTVETATNEEIGALVRDDLIGHGAGKAKAHADRMAIEAAAAQIDAISTGLVQYAMATSTVTIEDKVAPVRDK